MKVHAGNFMMRPSHIIQIVCLLVWDAHFKTPQQNKPPQMVHCLTSLQQGPRHLQLSHASVALPSWWSNLTRQYQNNTLDKWGTKKRFPDGWCCWLMPDRLGRIIMRPSLSLFSPRCPQPRRRNIMMLALSSSPQCKLSQWWINQDAASQIKVSFDEMLGSGMMRSKNSSDMVDETFNQVLRWQWVFHVLGTCWCRMTLFHNFEQWLLHRSTLEDWTSSLPTKILSGKRPKSKRNPASSSFL